MALDPVLRLAVLQRDNECCTECGKTDVPLDAHHIIPVKYGGEDLLENLRALCKSCHKRLELKMKELKLREIPCENMAISASCGRKSISVFEDTYNRIAAFGKTGMSFEDTLQIVLEKAEESQPTRYAVRPEIRSMT